MSCIFDEEHLSESLTTPVNWNAARKLAKQAACRMEVAKGAKTKSSKEFHEDSRKRLKPVTRGFGNLKPVSCASASSSFSEK